MSNRHERRKEAKLSRRRQKILTGIIPEGFGSLPKVAQPALAIKAAYKAWHAGKISTDDARLLGCQVTKGDVP